MRRKTAIGIAIAATTAVVASAAAFAGSGRCGDGHGMRAGFGDGGHHGRHHGMGMAHGAMSEHMVGRMVERLDLSDEQRDRLFAAIDAARPQMRSLGFDLMDNHRALRDLQPGAEGYQEQVAELARRQGELMERMIVARAGLKEQLRGVLTPEQAARFDEMHQDLHDRHGGRHGKGRDASSS